MKYPFRYFYFLLVAFIVTSCSGINSHVVNETLEVHTLYSSLSNIHIVKYGDAFFMVDAGVPGEESIIENQIKALGFEPKECKFIMLTHGHTDHAGTAAYFQTTYQIPIICGEGDTSLVLNGTNDSLCATSFLGSFIKFFIPENYPPCQPDILINRSVNLENYGIPGKIIPISGHTKGSLLLQLENIAFVGDMIRGKAMARKTPALHFYQCDLEQNKQNLISTLSLDADIWFTGHFGPLSKERVSQWLLSNPYHTEEN